MKPKQLYILVNGDVVPVYDMGNNYYCLSGQLFVASKSHVFSDREDAMYSKLILELQRGKPLENFRSSKYYGYYIERLKKENPEFII